MKSVTAIILIGALGLLAGCSTVAEPTPSTTNTPAVAPAAPQAAPGDITPTTVHALPSKNVVKDLVTVSRPLTPVDTIRFDPDKLTTVHTDATHIVQSQPATSVQLPIDNTDGEAYLFLSAHSDDPVAIDAALRAVKVFDAEGVQLNVRAPKRGVDDPKPMSAISLAGKKPGLYTIKLDTVAAKTGFALDARLASSPLKMELTPSAAQHLLGNDASIDVFLADSGSSIPGARVTGQLELPDGALGPTLTFADIGGGKYRANLTTALGLEHPTGAYTIRVRSEGTTADGRPFLRTGHTGIHYGIPSARIADVGATRVVTDGAGNIAAFEVDVKLESASLDRLEVSAMLTAIGADGAEHGVAEAFVGQGFEAGMHTFTLRFDAGHARLTKLEGTYIVRNLKVFSLATNATFHKMGFAANKSFPGVQRMRLAPLAKLNPAIEQLVSEGVLFAD